MSDATPGAPVRAILAAVDTTAASPRAMALEAELDEFVALAQAAGARIVERVVQRRDAVDPATLLGSGKAQELAALAREVRADLLLVFNDLRPRQRKNLEQIVALPIVDRTMLILDVFARQARSREGKMQVELAQLRYRQSKLAGTAGLSRLGGGIGARGPGETRLEVDRRRIAARVDVLTQRLADVRRQRAVRRDGARDPLVALVGYTNAGKSSLLNALTRGDALVADRPFATLDPTVRRAYLAPNRYVRLADTVGFITDLPPDLVTAFQSTLEELREADVLVHVLDASNPYWPQQQAAVERVLRDLKIDRPPVLLAFNKSDRLAGAPPAGGLAVSAATGAGLPELRAALDRALQAQG